VTRQGASTRSAPRWVVEAVVVAAGISVCVAGLLTSRLDGVQARWEDQLQPGVDASHDPEIVVVAFDRTTLAALGTGWPVPRDVHAELLGALGLGLPRVIVYDVLFASEQPGDDALAAALAAQPTVIASALTLRREADSPGPPVAADAVLPTPELESAATAVGHANVTLAADTGVVRSLPVFATDERGVPIPSLALGAVALADGASPVPVQRPDGVQVGDRRVPAPGGELAINWSDGISVDDVVPAIEVLDGSVAPERFADAIVLVGVTEPTLGDQHLVPVDRSGATSGVVVIANALNTMLTSAYLSGPESSSEVLVLVVVGIVVGLLFSRFRILIAALATVALLALLIASVTWRFHVAGERWNVVWPVVATVTVGAGLWAWRYVVEIRHRNRAWALFSTYVPATVVDELADPTRLRRVEGGERRMVSVLFCDLRGFTPIAAQLDPTAVRRLLDHYYEYVVDIVHRHVGTVMQFVGDEVFAIFGAPVADDGAGHAAVACACELQDRVTELDERLIADGLPPIRYGIGVHRGWVTTAHVGTSERRQYAAIGDTVNVGSRLCGAAGAGEVVLSAVAAENRCEARSLGSADELVLKGVAAPVIVVRRPAPTQS
jgi:adenylate cyclase